jgi:hypothetical protein
VIGSSESIADHCGAASGTGLFDDLVGAAESVIATRTRANSSYQPLCYRASSAVGNDIFSHSARPPGGIDVLLNHSILLFPWRGFARYAP